MLGQIRVEFIFGVAVFAILIFFITAQTNIFYSSVFTDSKTDALRARAIGIMRSLTETPGDPKDWQFLFDVNITKRVGLAESSLKLEPSKLNVLDRNCHLFDIYDVTYRIRAYNSTHRLLSCGLNRPQPPTVIITRYVLIGNDMGNITLELY